MSLIAEAPALRAALRHLLPLRSETQWSDLLATFIEVDPATASDLFGLDAGVVTARRESAVAGRHGRDRIDLLVTVDSEPVAGIEVKVLSGQGPKQLSRYEQGLPADVSQLFVVHPQRLVVDLGRSPRWRGVTWEQVLDAFAASGQSWVAATARAAREHLDGALPAVHADTAWDALQEGFTFPLQLAVRASWVHGHLRVKPPMDHDLVFSGAGNSRVVRMYVETPVADHWAIAEVEERLPVRSIPGLVTAVSRRPLGPSIKVGLLQANTRTSRSFDWAYLRDAWPLMAAARDDWVTNSARPRAAHDVEAWQRIVAQGAPRWLGIGFGDRSAQDGNSCMFGARMQLPPDTTLQAVVDEMASLAPLLTDIAAMRQR